MPAGLPQRSRLIILEIQLLGLATSCLGHTSDRILEGKADPTHPTPAPPPPGFLLSLPHWAHCLGTTHTYISEEEVKLSVILRINGGLKKGQEDVLQHLPKAWQQLL